MAKPLPKNKLLEGIFAPINAELNINDPIVLGEIPHELNGAFFRNGPNPQYPFSEKYHFFEGDGMIHALFFKNGEVSYCNRFIRSEKFKLEREARRALFAGLREFGKNDPSVKNMRADNINTNIIWHGGKLLALQEGTLPYQINPLNLDTIGKYQFDDSLANYPLNFSMIAHPKIDSATSELIFYSYVNPPETEHIYYYVADKNNKIIKSEKIKVPYLSLLHDFAITENYVIFPLFPLVFDYQRAFNGGNFYEWEPERGSYFGIMPRNGSNDDVGWIHLPDALYLSIHTVAAYEEENKIILDLMLSDIPKTAQVFTDDDISYPSILTRFVFDIDQKTFIDKIILDKDVPGEFPRIDDRFMGKKYNHVYNAATFNSAWYGFYFDAIIHYDLANGSKQVHHFHDAMLQEPVFVPRSPDAPEGDGFLLVYVYHKQENRSDLVILDAKQVDSEPVAIIQLPHRIPFGFHGSWVSAQQMMN